MTALILNSLLGGGLVSLVFNVLTLRWRVKKEREESRRLGLINAESASEILMEHIVDPLRKELNETKREMENMKVELQRLRRAIRLAHRCRYSVDCPVLHRMRDHERGEPEGAWGGGTEGRESGARQPD